MIALILSLGIAHADKVVVGAKAFTEGFVLGEYVAQLLERDPTLEISRRFGLGGTGIVFQALTAGEIDIYPEYTGTIAETILNHHGKLEPDQIRAALKERDIEMGPTLGFEDGYGLAVTADFARAHDITKISQLRELGSVTRVAFSSEFMSRADGYETMRREYDLRLKTRSMEHSLAFEAVGRGEADLIDVYSTDAKINKFNLKVLLDDRHVFPIYAAVLLARGAFVRTHGLLWRDLLKHSAGKLTAERVRQLNARLDLEAQDVGVAVADYLGTRLAAPSTKWNMLWQRTREHLVLVLSALLFSVVLGLPLGILADRQPRLGQVILLVSGTIQTIPSLALLCFLIPVFGIGLKPALVALCLYGLLPVVLNTSVGLSGIDPQLRDTAKALGLNFWHRLRYVELPLARANILAGIKTSAIVGIGTATLAALIGAGGYGASIVSGLAINDTHQILLGAVPAACMSLFCYALFWLLDLLLA